MSELKFTPPRVSVQTYVGAFVGCLALTLFAYGAATSHLHRNVVLAVVGGLAVVQCSLQLLQFLHLGEERGPRFRLAAFLMMLSLLLILVIGSIWIMDNLNYRMTPQQMNRYLQGQNGL